MRLPSLSRHRSSSPANGQCQHDCLCVCVGVCVRLVALNQETKLTTTAVANMLYVCISVCVGGCVKPLCHCTSHIPLYVCTMLDRSKYLKQSQSNFIYIAQYNKLHLPQQAAYSTVHPYFLNPTK